MPITDWIHERNPSVFCATMPSATRKRRQGADLPMGTLFWRGHPQRRRPPCLTDLPMLRFSSRIPEPIRAILVVMALSLRFHQLVLCCFYRPRAMSSEHDTTSRRAASIWFRTGWSKLVCQIERKTSRSDAEDLLQDAYVRMVAHDVRPDNNEAYLVRSAVNRGNDAYRMEEVRERNHADIAMTLLRQAAPLQDEVLLAQVRLKRVSQGIEQLPPRTREVFLLQRIDGLKYREIAAKLAISQTAVEKHMTRAMTFLGEWMKDW